MTTKQDLRFVYDGWHMIATESVSGSTFTVKNAYTWGLDVSGTRGGAGGIGGLVAWYDYSANKKYAPSYDGRGNVSLVYGLTDAHVISEYEYDPYGRMLRTTGYTYASSTWSMVSYDPVNNPFRYQTKWHLQGNLGVDRDSGFTQFDIYDYGKRWYHPKQGRFINRDPIGEQGGLNLYGYCGNDPINQIDMLGQSWLSSFLHNPGKALKHLWKEIRPVVTVAAVVVASVVTYGAVSGWAVGAMTVTEATATTYSIGGLAISAGTAEVVGGAVGGFVAGGVSGSILTGNVKGALLGAAAGALTGGVDGYFGSTWNLKHIAANSVAGGAGAEIMGGDFKTGFGFALAASSANALYVKLVKYKLDASPGGEAVQKGELTPPIQGANNIGTQNGSVIDPTFWQEGGSLSTFLNQVPGINAVAGLHDYFQISLGSGWPRTVFNAPGMPVAGAIAYAGLMTGNTSPFAVADDDD